MNFTTDKTGITKDPFLNKRKRPSREKKVMAIPAGQHAHLVDVLVKVGEI